MVRAHISNSYAESSRIRWDQLKTSLFYMCICTEQLMCSMTHYCLSCRIKMLLLAVLSAIWVLKGSVEKSVWQNSKLFVWRSRFLNISHPNIVHFSRVLSSIFLPHFPKKTKQKNNRFSGKKGKDGWMNGWHTHVLLYLLESEKYLNPIPDFSILPGNTDEQTYTNVAFSFFFHDT